MTRSQMINVLTMIQNSAENLNRDVLSFAGMCNVDELRAYVLRQFKALPDTRKCEILEHARSL
jgi:hypothetical protein